MRWITVLLMATPALADPPRIDGATLRAMDGGWQVSVTLSHPDTGWDHYADGWRVELPDGTVLGTRTLLHPHVDEQPFTRSLSGVIVPEATAEVVIRARCLLDGWSHDTFSVALP